ncbi:MAG: FAD-dependent oxidoreductase [Cyanobium sp.]
MVVQDLRAQVVVWGGGTGGVAAAVQAARGGADTLLLTPGAWLGGMVSAAGVCCPDGNELSPWQTGLWGAFLRELARREPEGLDHNWVSCFGYRPATAEAILRDWCSREPRLRWLPDVQLEAVERRGERITALELRHRDQACRIALQLLIDGSDRGDIYPLAAVPHRFGWEARELWQEPSAPLQADLDRDPFFQRQPVQSPTWVVMGQLDPDRRPSPPGTVTPAVAASANLPEPFCRAAQSFGLERTLSYGRLPGGLVMLNWPLHGNDWHQDPAALFADDPARRNAARRGMQELSLHFLEALKEASGGRLRAAACFPRHGRDPALEGPASLALMPYWREGRRLIASALVREQDLLPQGPGETIAAPCRDAAGAITAIAVGNYANDHHYPGPDWPLAPKSCRWGGRWSGTPFTLPYGALYGPGVANLLAADKATGVSHMANGATRLQPLILNTGQAAGAAAALCIARNCLPSDLPVRELQEALISDPLAPSAVVPLWDTPWHHPRWAERQRAVLEDPSCLTRAGTLAGAEPADDDPSPPPEPGEQLWQGELVSSDGGYALHLADGSGLWPVITLEPALHRRLLNHEGVASVGLIGCANPWGPWLRVSRIA